MERRKHPVSMPAYLTVYLALTMTILLSLFLALIEGVRYGAIRMEAECVTDVALNSIFAEYHRELYRQYNLLGIDTSYGTAYPSVNNTEEHLARYLERNMTLEGVFLEDWLYRDFLGMKLGDAEITQAAILTDYGGAVFMESAISAIQDEIGLTGLAEILEWMQVVETEDLLGMDVAEWKQEVDEEIRQYGGGRLTDLETELSEGQSLYPTEQLDEKRKRGILSLVMPEDAALSGRGVNAERLLSRRMECGLIHKGNATLPSQGEETLADRFLFHEYLMRYMGCFGQEKEQGALSYQIEYLLQGKTTDEENLRATIHTICMLREAANAIYLFSDQEKCALVEGVATALASAIFLPELAPLLQVTLILGWAYGESLQDMQTLMAGGRVPLMKDAGTWQLSLEGALEDTKETGEGEEVGLSYEDYLRLLLMFEQKENVVMRAMDLVEADIRLTSGNHQFRLDGCYTWLESRIRIESGYGYRCEITQSYGYDWNK